MSLKNCKMNLLIIKKKLNATLFQFVEQVESLNPYNAHQKLMNPDQGPKKMKLKIISMFHRPTRNHRGVLVLQE